ncbi:V/A-type H+-transporting ATPase subunit K [Brevinema andersonii]|uniref:ATP synthase F(0) sector subunit c n=1 Tax=Brevinema andersonii TaxID=34097 RepID=A0A1I1DWK7_BREAD|nr:ATP synthase subunit C [Brevinema andersonii]SFB77090.1 V/A-type H+-transporting ATPase subunit K [Brevinema andersonii]
MIVGFTLFAVICFVCLIGLGLHIKINQNFLSVYAAKSILGGVVGFFFIILALATAYVFLGISPIFAAEPVTNSVSESAYGLGFLGAGLSVGLACIGAGIATGMATSAGIGAVSDNPKMLGQSLLFVGLSEGIAIYGLIIAIMILGRLA